ncbi:EAL domain-containing protein [Emcibacter sp.]|uniref:EAL domain-containing protein n=1 Tax=Emcibacter sp. TaxID=1979954 RepID=UPI002AA60F02|nr:EAL domain-containing protein [Emcibacter sp.]
MKPASGTVFENLDDDTDNDLFVPHLSDVRLRDAQIRTLHSVIVPNVIASLLLGFVFLWLIWGRVPQVSAMAWYGALAVSLLPRLSLTLYTKRIETEKSQKNWLRLYLLFTSFSGLVWGSAIFFSADSTYMISPYLIMAMLAGLSAVTVLVGVAHRLAVWAFMVPCSIPVLFHFIGGGELHNYVFALACVIFVLLLGYAGSQFHRIFVASVSLRRKNRELVHEISEVYGSHYKSIESLHHLVDQMGGGLAMFDRDFNLIIWNKAYQKIFELPDNVLQMGVNLRDLGNWQMAREGFPLEKVKAETEQQIRELESRRIEGSYHKQIDFSDGRVFDMRADFLSDGETILNFSDMTHRAQASTDALVKMAQLDSLTNLPNRMMFRRELKKKLLQSKNTDKIVSVILVNIDNFKNINDVFGHAVGDNVIVRLGEVLKTFMRPDEFLARLGGDEFAITGDQYEDVEAVLQEARSLKDNTRKAINIEGAQIPVELSIGITYHPHDKGNAEHMVRNAGIALHKAKEEGGSQVIIFDTEMQAELVDRNTLLSDIRENMESSQFLLHYQPQIDLNSRQICGVEALMRWNHPERGFVSPGEFIPLAEWSKQIIPLTEQLLPEACVQAKLWQARGLPAFPVSVNISPLHFHDNRIVDFVRECLEEASLEPQYLELEITEGIVMSKTEEVLTTLRGLADLGIQLSIDDFGTGYSSLSYLPRLPVDKLKIDRAFVSGMMADRESQSLIEAIISMGHSFDLKVIAEGVEDAEQLDLLAQLKCDQAQGYYISRPMEADRVTEWFRAHSSK